MTTQSSIMSPVRLGDGLVELLPIVKPDPTENSWEWYDVFGKEG